MLRQLTEKEASGDTKEKDKSEVEEARLKEQLASLHRGWLEHPVSLKIFGDLESVLIDKTKMMHVMSLMSPQDANPYGPEVAVLTKVLNCIKNNTPYN